jgi:hypothetical protein
MARPAFCSALGITEHSVMRPTTDHVNEGRDQTADTLNHATEEVADTMTYAARPADHLRQDAGQTRKNAAEEPRMQHSRWSHGWRRHTWQGKESPMQNRYNALPRWDDGPPAWQPQPGEVLAGMIDRYTISDTPQGLVRTVIVTEARTGEQVSLRLASTCLLSLFAQYQPHLGERIDVRYRWHAPDHSYQRWRLLMDRPETLDFSPLGGEASDEAPWHREPLGASVIAGSTPHIVEGWIRQPAPHPERTPRRPRLVMKPRTANPA